jgi:hypothetical protein
LSIKEEKMLHTKTGISKVTTNKDVRKALFQYTSSAIRWTVCYPTGSATQSSKFSRGTETISFGQMCGCLGLGFDAYSFVN